jgi:hypothetical protein
MEARVPSAAARVCRRATAFDASPKQAWRSVPCMTGGPLHGPLTLTVLGGLAELEAI